MKVKTKKVWIQMTNKMIENKEIFISLIQKNYKQ